MSKKNTLSRNAGANVTQALVGTVLLFALYRHINTTLGVEKLGVWSVVLAAVSASRLAEFGLSAGVTRFIARDLARGNPARAANVLDTATLTLLVLVGAALPLLYALLAKLLSYLFEGEYLIGALEILPYAMFSLWLTVGASVFQGGLDGCQRMDLRAALVVSGQALLLVLALLLIPYFGLLGLAWAQIGQGVFLLLGGRMLLHRTLPTLPWMPSRWSKSVLREMLGYGVNIQAAGIFMVLFDTLTKMLMARFGGPAAAGYFEMANQVVIKARSIIVSANQAVVPHVASLIEKAPEQVSSLYTANLRILVFVALPGFSLIIVYAGDISWLLMGDPHDEFILLVSLLAVAWLGNTLTAPAYLFNMGSGHVGWNTLSHVLTGVLNLLLGIYLGSLYGACGVAVAYAVALLSGSGMLILIFNARNQPDRDPECAWEHLWLVVACVAVVVFSWLDGLGAFGNGIIVSIGMWLVPLIVLGAAAWFHPVRRQVQRAVILRKPRRWRAD